MLPWNGTMSVGDPGLDRDIRAFVDMLNAIEERLLEGADQEARRQVRQLIDGLQTHFASTERILRRHGYPHLSEHARNHESALILAELLQTTLDRGHVAAALAHLDDLMHFFSDVVVDRETAYAAFLRTHDSGPSPRPPELR